MPKNSARLSIVKDGSVSNRPRNVYADFFADAFTVCYDGARCPLPPAGFVKLAELTKLYEGNLDVADWEKAVKNYFLTPQKRHTLADLCVNYATFRLHALDRFGQPFAVKQTQLAKSLEQFK